MARGRENFSDLLIDLGTVPSEKVYDAIKNRDLEIFPEKIDDNFNEISDEDLLSLKNKLIGELLNEPNKDQ